MKMKHLFTAILVAAMAMALPVAAQSKHKPKSPKKYAPPPPPPPVIERVELPPPPPPPPPPANTKEHKTAPAPPAAPRPAKVKKYSKHI